MKKAFVFLAAGFEEMEAIGTIDILRRGGIDTVTVSISDSKEVIGAHGIPVTADTVLTGTDLSGADALVLPGGMPGSTNLNNCEPLREALASQYDNGKLVAAICAAPLVLGGLGILEERRATCYPSFEDLLTGATVTDNAVEVDGNVITGRGPGLVMEFALALVTYLAGKEKADEVGSGLLLK
ncbi:MAG: DJ-1/PfpI family protein [Tannerellaceae bacterium]|nr:DJ-1/PfpI family protein [Tannerellaceae bacterium]